MLKYNFVRFTLQNYEIKMEHYLLTKKVLYVHGG